MGDRSCSDRLCVLNARDKRDRARVVLIFVCYIHSMSIDEIKMYTTMKESFAISVISAERPRIVQFIQA
jgi:hypothetical protein